MPPGAPRAPLDRRKRRWRLAAAAAVVVVFVVPLAVLVEPTLLRPLIRHVVESQSGRTIAFDALRVGLGAHLGPRLEFDGLVIENARWAASREPFVRARRVVLELAWNGLASGIWVLRRIVLEDAEVDLERDKDGRRNARLSDAEGRGPAHAQVLSIDARRTRLRILDAVTDLDLRLESTPLATPRTVAGFQVTRTIRFEGRHRGTPLSGQADVSDTVTLQRTGEPFALEGELRTAAARLNVSGTATDLLVGLGAEVDLHLQADPLSALDPALLPRLPALREVSADAHFTRDAQHWSLSRLHARSRGSEIDGDIVVGRGDRPKVDARLRAARFDVDEWIAAAAHRTAARAAVQGAAFDATGLERFDATLDLQLVDVSAARGVVAHDARLQGTLAHGRLQLSIPSVDIAGGRGSGVLRLDAAATPPAATFEARVAGLRLAALPAAWRATRKQVTGGRIDATAALAARGSSAAEWLASASGTASASLDGAAVSDRLEAKLGLDGIAFVRSLLSGADAVPLRCAEAALDLRNGIGTIRRLAFDTARTAVAGSGSVDFVGRRLDLVLVPTSHVDAPLALHRDIRIEGPLAKPRVSLQARVAGPSPAPCAGERGN